MQGRFLKGFWFIFVLMLLGFGCMAIKPVQAATSIKQEFKASAGVTYQDYRINTSARNQAVRVLKANLSDPYTQIKVGIPDPLNKLSKTIARALTYYAPRHRVVGTINASFFGPTGLPVYLIAENNQLINAGKLPIGKTEYANEPIAFGMKDGKGLIAHYNLDLHFVHNGKSTSITASNKARATNQLILYTAKNPSKYTDTSEKGIEVVVEKLDAPLDLTFGSTVTGMVTKIRDYGDKTKTQIPKDGFVLSATGTSKAALKNIQIGDSISLAVDIDTLWQGADFMLGSGPMLVNKGKVDLSMDPKSPNAITRAPHTAVAVDKTGRNVFFVTVDGRQPGYSTGMNLTEFAQFLVSIGAYQALNLDGGGSTAMGVRYPGDSVVKLANSPADGFERYISTTLMAVSTAPNGQPTYIKAHKSNTSVLLKGSSIKILLDYVLDQYYNPVKASTKNLSITSKLGTAKGTAFTAAKAGKGTLTVKYSQAATSLPVEIVDQLAKLTISKSNLLVRNGDTVKLSVKGYDRKGRTVLMAPNAIQWSVTGKLGTISKDGTFTVTGTKGSGQITAAYGKTKAVVAVNIGPDQEVLDTFDQLTNWTVSSIRATAFSQSSTKKEPVKEGKAALKFNYDFTVSKSNTSAAYLNAAKSLVFTSRPNAIGVYVYGDGKNNWLRATLTDGKGKSRTIDFTKDMGLSWQGWKFVKAAIPKDVALPIKLKQIYVVQPHQELKSKGTLYFDQLQVFYGLK